MVTPNRFSLLPALFLLLAFAGSGCAAGVSGTASGGSSYGLDFSTTCADYASICPNEPLPSGRCNEGTCDDWYGDSCLFLYCAVEVGLCDNENSGDPEVLACMKSYL